MTVAELQPLVLSNPEAAEVLGISLWMLENYKRRGWLVPIVDRQTGRTLAYLREDIERLKAKLAEMEPYRPKPGPKRNGPWVRPWKKGKEAGV